MVNETFEATEHTPRAAELRRLVRKRMPLNHGDVPFIVCWSQKSGCTTILKWYLYHAGLLEEALQYHEDDWKLNIHSYENKVFKARAGYKRDLVQAIQCGKPVISFMRCPYRRAFSSYLTLHEPNFLLLAGEGLLSAGMSVRMRVLEALYGGQVSIEYPFSFLDYLLWLAEQDFSALNPHHTPQHRELYDQVPVTYFKLEDFDVVVSELEAHYSLPSSSLQREKFTSMHHHKLSALPEQVTLTLFRKAIPVRRTEEFRLPVVSRAMLEGTEFDSLI